MSGRGPSSVRMLSSPHRSLGRSRSVHSKLLGLLLLTLLVVTGSTLALVAIYSVRGSKATLVELELQLRESLEVKGWSLASNQATALRSLVADAAFGDIAALVRQTRRQEEDVLYGVFRAADGQPLAYVSPAAEAAALAPPRGVLPPELEGVGAAGPGLRTVQRLGQSIFEFTASVREDDTVLGTITYGLSTARLRAAVESARNDARGATRRTIMLLALLGQGGLVMGLLLARRAAHRITAPIEELTVAARQIAAGGKRIRVEIYSGDEIELLGQSFDKMVSTLARAYAELERLNHELEQRVQDRTVELRQANADLESFTYSVSHDLRAPLRAIDGFIQILEEEHGADFDDDARDLFARVRGAAQAMAALIDDLLALSRVGPAAMHMGPTDVRGLAADILVELRELNGERSIDVKLSELPSCLGDPAFLRQVLANLLGNAFKFTQKRERALIEVGHQETARGPAYFVRDNGAGFDMRYADKLFGVFQRLHRQKDFPGTGVGLSIVKRIIERHGGAVWAESAPDRGATFFFMLPKAPAPAA